MESTILIMGKWIGLPFTWGGCSSSGVDCAGLVRLYLREELGVDLPPDDGPHDPASWLEDSQPRIISYLDTHGHRVESPQRGDVVVIHYRFGAAHTGVMMDKQRILHIIPGQASYIGWLSCYGAHRIVGFWRVI